MAISNEARVKAFNKCYTPGDRVLVLDDKGSQFIDTIEHRATIMGGHTPMAWLKNKGSYLLDWVIGPVKHP